MTEIDILHKRYNFTTHHLNVINEWHKFHMVIINQAITDFEHEGCESKYPINIDGKEIFVCDHANRKFIFCNNNLYFGVCPEQQGNTK